MGKSPDKELQQDVAVNTSSIMYGVTNPKWISIKVQYFFTFVGLASFQPFAVLFYASLGLTTPQIGIIEFMNIFISMISRPLIGTVADKSKRHSFVLAACIVFFLVPCTSMAFFSRSTQEQHAVTLSLGEGDVSQKLEVCGWKSAELMLSVTELFAESRHLDSNTTTGRIICQNLRLLNWSAVPSLQSKSTVNNCSMFLLKTENDFKHLYNESKSVDCVAEFSTEVMDTDYIFLWICLLRSLGALTLGPSISLTDSIAYDMLGPEHSGSWGQQRMFGTLAWGLTAFVMGVVMDHTRSFLFCFVALFFMHTPTIFIALFWLPRRLNRSQAGQTQQLVPFGKAIRSVFASPIFSINCLVAIASGILLGILQVLWPQLFRDLGAPKLFFGLAAVVVCTFEIPSLFFAGAVVNKIGEPVCFLLMFLAYAVRFGANALLTSDNFWFGLTIEILHLFCYGLYFAAASRMAAKIAPPGTSSTVQGILATSYAGIGTGSGVLVASWIYQKFGRVYAFLIYAAFALLCFIALLILYFAYLRNEVAKLSRKAAAKEQEAKKIEELTQKDPLMSGHFDEL